MRQFVLGNSSITIVNFYARVFESADVDSAILIFKKSTEDQRVRLFEYTDGFQFIKEADSRFFLGQREHIINVEAFKAGGTAALMQKVEANSACCPILPMSKLVLRLTKLDAELPHKQTK